ncbi:uncharacterized protein VICG_01857 [Vittaforma corneae ATCC 50505]|uniref:DNA helicase n=1 Tax=Vittaforma corneae (strain ATCC 50505) TaxID=993615 RepID=L2GKB4_VITCO|nr:uncharacterized protein VICG_01857 [Vittaforma corneae ATCC 50505]ELA41064.1 hypothetical protein VICG_01857 [Vittaforma corneae ATCC 50505]
METGEIPLKTWSLYFPNEEYTAFNKEISLVIAIRKTLSISPLVLKGIIDSGIFECEYATFSKFDSPSSACISSTLMCFSCAVSERIFESFGKAIYIETRIINHNEICQFSEISTSKVDTLVTLIGTCCRVGFRKIENLESYFECVKCSKILKVQNQNNIYRIPKCPCKSKSVVFLSGHTSMKCTDKQEIKIQEIFTSGSNTKILEIDVYGSLVGALAPGDMIQLTGIVKAELSGEAYKLKIKCNNLQIIKNRNNLRNEQYFQTDFEIFKKISEEPNLISIFINNLYPDIYGNTLIKAGLVLSLFGGTRKYAGAQSVRSEIHVLIVGDPGLGKSKLLLNTCSILPKSTYVSGNFCTTAGLTVSISHDPITGEYMTDAGALVVSDGGVCCIDEFDKIDDHTALYEAMEDQKVTVAKGGVCCSVPTRSTIVAATNPKNGHFDMTKSIRENLKFDLSLISRFDLVFILRDDLNEKENYEIGNQILKKRHCGMEDPISSLVKDLRSDAFIKNNSTVYTPEILKKYIEYARMTVNPVLSKVAKQKIKDYYLEIRKENNTSIRNLESLMRLTESYARMELKSVASGTHASFAINLHRKIFIKDEKQVKTGKVNFEGILKKYIEINGTNTISKENLMDLIRQLNSTKPEQEVLETLNFQGLIIKKSSQEYKINIIN